MKLGAPKQRQESVAAQKPRPFRFSVAAIESPRDTFATYSRLSDRLAALLGREVELVQRRTYDEVNDLLATGQIDAAILCVGGYLDLRRRAPTSVEVLAVPVIAGRSTFQSLVIVPAASEVTTLGELRGKRFAYTDQLSFTGHRYLTWFLRHEGLDPSAFFGSTMLTGSHDRSIAIVAKGLVDGAAVSGLVYAHLLLEKPELAAQTRIVYRSPYVATMPVVASTKLGPDERARVRDVFFALSKDAEAAAALRIINIDGFAAPTPSIFDVAANVVEARR